ncbi:MAG: superoxide dismutase family protein, partial [Bdellovibrionales bacterium]|nr:superoxide dismutase family protein [Bdellovibrionales bacterium]
MKLLSFQQPRAASKFAAARTAVNYTVGIGLSLMLSYGAATAQSPTTQPSHALAVLHTSTGQAVGSVFFEQKGDGVEVTAQLIDLEPGKRGFHVHEFGDCSSSDFKSAGGHFSPQAHPHGGPNDMKRHA